MTLLRFLVILSASWAILATAGTAGWCAVVAIYRRRRPATVRASYPPPVPAPLPRPESDTTWLSAWPVSGAHLIDVDAVHGLLSEDEVYPTADEAEQRVFDKLCDEIDANFRVLGEAA